MGKPTLSLAVLPRAATAQGQLLALAYYFLEDCGSEELQLDAETEQQTRVHS